MRGLLRSRWVTVSNLSLAAWSERLVRNADRTVRVLDNASRAKLGLLVRTSSSTSKERSRSARSRVRG
jgi:hypothetical protein